MTEQEPGRRARRARGAGPTMVTIYWRDIPAQVSVKGSDARRLLPPRFQVAIDRAAMVADKADTDAYVAEWRQVTAAVTGDPLQQAIDEAARLDTSFDQTRLDAVVANGGLDPDQPQPGDTP